MTIHWSRNNGIGMLSKHFTYREMECRDNICKAQMINDTFLAMLEAVRELYGKPITVTSGFRCALRQATLAKQGLETALGISSHQLGIAADIAGEDMKALEEACLEVFKYHSVGVAKAFIHVDSRPGGPRRWTYKT